MYMRRNSNNEKISVHFNKILLDLLQYDLEDIVINFMN